MISLVVVSSHFNTTKATSSETEQLLHPNIRVRFNIKAHYYLKKMTSKPNSAACNQRVRSIKREWEDVLYLPLNPCFWVGCCSLCCRVFNKGRKDTERREDMWRSPDAHRVPKDVPYTNGTYIFDLEPTIDFFVRSLQNLNSRVPSGKLSI